MPHSCSLADTMRSLTRYQIEILIPFLFLAGCTTTRPSPAPEQPERPVRKSTAGDSSTSMRVATTSPFSSGRVDYNFRIFSTTHALVSDSTRRIDSSLVVGILTATLSVSPSRNTVLARVESDSVAITRGSGTSVPILPSEVFLFTIDTRTGQVIQTNRQTTPDCTNSVSDSSPIYGREVLPSISTPITQAWADTVHTLMCRGGALLTVTRIASYTHLQSPDSAKQLLRSTQFYIAGNGRQWNQKIEVSGEGMSLDTLRLSGLPIRLTQITGRSQVRFVFRTQLRVQEFLQTSTTHIALRS